MNRVHHQKNSSDRICSSGPWNANYRDSRTNCFTLPVEKKVPAAHRSQTSNRPVPSHVAPARAEAQLNATKITSSADGRIRDILRHAHISAKNQLEGKVVEVTLGDIMAHVVVKIGKTQIESVITRRSAEQLGLKKGDKVTVVISRRR